ncbi:hypothetical protein K0M31_004591 [Melipona bicolor]|uniref:Uncharacterized protein n=1 Tax=Melipona bicolor TaxID=60889 RepID=A0AA40FXJ5_9HYME|nr:hypothetical protein K0M31_004591 [Melipona bicolor]
MIVVGNGQRTFNDQLEEFNEEKRNTKNIVNYWYKTLTQWSSRLLLLEVIKGLSNNQSENVWRSILKRKGETRRVSRIIG